ncbi:LacI family transcriptional regulator [Nesterenkonia massiliensis]|uniref:LacI family transcriptional regulator n=1 Tax=Nesterenkonia massiliensis TaxID=1232429 RepID=A0ABT2HNR4_9MICC|nr:LacI family transcriptional regulator [Nesterenkonia massiliensis]
MTNSKDVARLAGVSQATVSRVLNGSAPISEDTRRRVMKAVEELGYVKHAGATAMRTRRTRTVGIVVSEMSNPFFQEIFDELILQFASAGLRTMVWHAGAHAQDAVNAIRDRAIDGMVFTALSEDSPEMQAALQAERPLLLINRTTDTLNYDCVVSDNLGGGRLVADYLAAAGRTDALLVAGDLTTSTGRDRRAGFLDAMKEHGAPVPESRQLPADYSAPAAFSLVKQHLEQHGAPEAIFCSNDAMAVAVMNALKEHGVSVPEQTWVLGYDDVAASSWPLVSLTTVSQSSRAMARAGAELLLKRLQNPDLPWQRKIFPARLEIRGSTAHFRA